jgi:myo-inositol 2-dehydrogenase / D-chiro-inositol 1-dehydrogenase
VAAIRKPLTIGLVGCGWFAQAVHLPILRRLSAVDLIALAESDPAQLQAAGRHFPAARMFADYRGLLQMRDLDAVVVSVPNALHAEVAIAVMQLGKHLYLEKPIATSLREADEIVSAWKHSGVVGMMGFNYRFNALHQTARMYLQAGKLGPLTEARTVFTTPTRSMPAWKKTRLSGGGVLLDLASHHVDLVRFLFQQDIRLVYCEIESRSSEQDTATLQLQLADGLRVQSYFSLAAVDEDRLEIYGQAGELTVDRYRSLDVDFVDAGRASSRLGRVTRRLRSFRDVPYLIKKIRSPWHEPSYRESLSGFVSAALGRDKASPDLLDGYRSLEVICAAEESAQTGRSVSLPPSLTASSKDAKTVLEQ